MNMLRTWTDIFPEFLVSDWSPDSFSTCRYLSMPNFKYRGIIDSIDSWLMRYLRSYVISINYCWTLVLCVCIVCNCRHGKCKFVHYLICKHFDGFLSLFFGVWTQLFLFVCLILDLNWTLSTRISRSELSYPKAILSSNPSNGNYTLVLLAYISYEPSLAFIRSGEEEWTLIPGRANCKEMAYHNGLLYTATKEGVIEAWDLNGPSPANSMVVFPDQRLYSWHQRSLMYLASSSWGDLLQVWWETDSDGLYLNVYKVDFARRKLVKIDCLGDQALFLGGNHSLCLSSVEVSEVRGNCIYFSDDWFDLPPFKDHEHLGVYNLKEGSFEALFPFDIRSSWQHPIWIRPSFA